MLRVPASELATALWFPELKAFHFYESEGLVYMDLMGPDDALLDKFTQQKADKPFLTRMFHDGTVSGWGWDKISFEGFIDEAEPERFQVGVAGRNKTTIMLSVKYQDNNSTLFYGVLYFGK